MGQTTYLCSISKPMWRKNLGLSSGPMICKEYWALKGEFKYKHRNQYGNRAGFLILNVAQVINKKAQTYRLQCVQKLISSSCKSYSIRIRDHILGGKSVHLSRKTRGIIHTVRSNSLRDLIH